MYRVKWKYDWNPNVGRVVYESREDMERNVKQFRDNGAWVDVGLV